MFCCTVCKGEWPTTTDPRPVKAQGPPPAQVRRLGNYSNLCGTWWDANRTHLASVPAKAPIHTPPWAPCGSVTGRQVAVDAEGQPAGELPTCGGCRQVLRIREERRLLDEAKRQRDAAK